jgi:Holliday junction resolvase RusA-like endonuclease
MAANAGANAFIHAEGDLEHGMDYWMGDRRSYQSQAEKTKAEMKSSELTTSMLRAMHRPATLLKPSEAAIAAPTSPAKATLTTKPTHDSGIDVFLTCVPPTRSAQQKGAFVCKRASGKLGVQFFTKKAVKQAGEAMKAVLRPIVPAQPFDGPVVFDVRLVYPWLKSSTKAERANSLVPIITRPDCSNLVKQIEDVMTELGFWHDDSQICDLRVRKFRGIAGRNERKCPSLPMTRTGRTGTLTAVVSLWCARCLNSCRFGWGQGGFARFLSLLLRFQTRCRDILRVLSIPVQRSIFVFVLGS